MLLSLIVLPPEYHLPKNYQFHLAYNIYEIIIYSCIIQCDNGRNRPLYGAFGNGIPQRRFQAYFFHGLFSCVKSSSAVSFITELYAFLPPQSERPMT